MNGDSTHQTGEPQLRELIRGLSSSQSADRENSARELFRRGRERARTAIRPWLSSASLSALFIMDATNFPETTVGVAVEPATFDAIRQSWGSPALADVPPDQDAMEFELEFPHGVRLDVLSTRDRRGSGAIARHLEKFGESIQQVELLVENVAAAADILTSDFQTPPIYSATRPGANGTRVNFFLVPAPEGKKVLIELVEARMPA